MRGDPCKLGWEQSLGSLIGFLAFFSCSYVLTHSLSPSTVGSPETKRIGSCLCMVLHGIESFAAPGYIVVSVTTPSTFGVVTL